MLRPFFHHKTGRVEAPILVCFLSLALWRLEQWMKGKGLGTCARQVVAEITPLKITPGRNDIAPLDLAWFETGGHQVPIACTGVYHFAPDSDAVALASQLDIHGYLQRAASLSKFSGCPLVEIPMGKGRIVASEMCLESGETDPIAKQLLNNIVHYLESGN